MSDPSIDLLRFVQRSPLFKAFGEAELGAMLGDSAILQLDSGALLYDQESPPENLNLVLSGRLRAEHYVGGEVEVRREIGRGEAVGGISILAGRPHKARVRAIRDTTVLQVPATAFETLFDAQPAQGRGVVHRWLNRFFESSAEQQVRLSLGSTRSIAVVAGHAGAPVEAVARGLGRALAEFNLSLRLDAQRVDQQRGDHSSHAAFNSEAGMQLSHWLNEQERRYRYLLLQSDELDSPWTERCLRQADRIVMVVDAQQAIRPNAMTRSLLARAEQADVELAVIGKLPGRARGWCDLAGTQIHHCLFSSSHREFQRLARMLSGRAIGVALGGGGARGFAHLGLFKAMQELQLEPDIIFGTSMGAFIGGLFATGMDFADAKVAAEEAWVKRKLLNDYTVPRVSLIRARKARRHMEQLFGSTLIEDLSCHYACMTTNLSRGRPQVHDHGRLAHWIGASMSVPGIAPPVIYKGDLLVDGGLLSPVPTQAIADLGRGPVIASDVSSDEIFRGIHEFGDEPVQAPPARRASQDLNIFQILYRTATLSTPEEFRQRLARADCYLRMPVDGVGMYDWSQCERLIQAGHQHAPQQLEQWLASR